MCTLYCVRRERRSRIQAAKARGSSNPRCDIGERSELLFRQLDWLPLKEELSFKRSSLIFRRIKDENACPGYITELLTRNSDRHIRNSRYGKYNLECPSYNKETERGRTFQASGTKPWNSIPLGIRKKDSIGSFKSSVRK